MKRKKVFAPAIFLLGIAVLLLFSACDDKNNPTSLTGNVSRPTWSLSEDYDFNTSMTAVIKVDLTVTYPNLASNFVVQEEDILAAFSDETCLGIAKQEDGLFFLYIAGPATSVDLRYWSAHYTNLFEAKNAFPYVNDTQEGTPDRPFIPNFVLAGK